MNAADDPSSPAFDWLGLSDEALLAHCRYDAFRGSGPGGQHRNKTSTGIRLTHLPTGIHVSAEDSRSQSQNKSRALGRLKLALASDLRRPIDPRDFHPPEWLPGLIHLRKLSVSRRHVQYAPLAAIILDLLHTHRGSVGDVAGMLGVSTSSIVKFLANEPRFWMAANRIRAELGQSPLQGRM